MNKTLKTLKVKVVEGVEYKLYINIDGSPSVRVFDVDSGETVGVRWFPTMNAAEAYYTTCLERA